MQARVSIRPTRSSRSSTRIAAHAGAALVAALMAFSAAGCGSCGREGGGATREDAAPEVASTGFKTIHMQAERSERVQGERAPMPPVPRVVSVRLLDPGKGRRRRLRYRLDDRARAFAITARIQTRRMAANDWEPRMTLPEIRYGLAVARTAEGLLAARGLEAEVGEGAEGKDGSADQGARAARAAEDFLGRYRANLERREATFGLDERGLLGDVTPVQASTGGAPAPGPHTRQELQQILLESVVPFPEEPVGKGGRWKVTTVLRRGAGVVKQVAVYELVAARKSRLRIAARLAQNGEHQVAQASGLPAGAVAELLALVWRANGELVVSPASATPLSGTLAVEYRVHSRVERGSQRADYFVESTGTIELSSGALPEEARVPGQGADATDDADGGDGVDATDAAGGEAPAGPAAGER